MLPFVPTVGRGSALDGTSRWRWRRTCRRGPTFDGRQPTLDESPPLRCQPTGSASLGSIQTLAGPEPTGVATQPWKLQPRDPAKPRDSTGPGKRPTRPAGRCRSARHSPQSTTFPGDASLGSATIDSTTRQPAHPATWRRRCWRATPDRPTNPAPLATGYSTPHCRATSTHQPAWGRPTARSRKSTRNHPTEPARGWPTAGS
jgi:hypothetical protein